MWRLIFEYVVDIASLNHKPCLSLKHIAAVIARRSRLIVGNVLGCCVLVHCVNMPCCFSADMHALIWGALPPHFLQSVAAPADMEKFCDHNSLCEQACNLLDKVV